MSNMMRFALLWCSLYCASVFHTTQGQLLRKLSPTSHYEEMNCTPLPSSNNVQAYRCPFESLRLPLDKCLYKGKKININEPIPDNECNVGCFCSKNNDDQSASFVCAIVDCWDFFTERNDSCVYQYKLGACCSSDQVCDAASILKLPRCCVEGKSYFEGEKFFPENSCKTCVCSKGFTGKLDAPYCKPVECGIERYNMNNIMARCAPVYLKGRDCCPIGWECYNSDSKIQRVGRPSTYSCTFGTKKLNVGDKVVVSNKCNKCSCDYPPLVTCVADNNCIP